MKNAEEITEAIEKLALKINEAIPEGLPTGVVLGALACVIGSSINGEPNIVDRSEQIDYVEGMIRKLAFMPSQVLS